MAISWSGAVALANKIASDVPAIKTMLDALAKMDFTGITGIPANVKRIASVTGGVQIQKYASNAWATVGKLMHDVDTVDGKHAATGTTANTIPVRDASGKLPGDITGNAATASKASALADGYTVPLAKGGTGATTAAAARANLGADNAANITKGTLSTARGGTGRTDGFVTDVVIDASGTKASEVGQLGRAKSLTSVDANTILKQGRYNVYKATTALNFPIAGDMLLDVIYWGDNNITQRCSSAGNSYKFEMSRSSYDNGATWGGWLPVSGFLNSDVHIYVAKNGSDTNSGYTSDKPVLTLGMAIYKMLMMKPGVGRNIILHFGPGDWGDFTLHKFYSSGAAVVMTTLAGANATSAPPDMPKFGTITVATGAVVYLRNIEADRVACSYLSRIHAQYYNTIGAVVSAYGGRFFFDSSSVTGIKAQSIQTSSYFYVYRHGLLDINGGATFDVLEAVSYSSAFLYAGEYSEVNIGSTSFANAGRVTGKRFNLTNALLTDGNRNNHLLFPGTAAGVYGYGNIINGYATDLAIGGDATDLASKRGYLVDTVYPWYDGVVDAVNNFNELVRLGLYHIRYDTATQNAPGGILGTGSYGDGLIEIFKISPASHSSSYARVGQRLTVYTPTAMAGKVFFRSQSVSSDGAWLPWKETSFTSELSGYLPLSGGTLTGPPKFSGGMSRNITYSTLEALNTIPEKIGIYWDSLSFNSNSDIEGGSPAMNGLLLTNVVSGGGVGRTACRS